MANLQTQPLTPRQQRFVEAFIVCGNATEATRRAGYSVRSARQIAAENLSKPDIQAAIAAARRNEAEYWQLQKRDVIEALLGVIERAKGQLNPAAMIRRAVGGRQDAWVLRNRAGEYRAIRRGRAVAHTREHLPCPVA
jgi:hypothetical protein